MPQYLLYTAEEAAALTAATADRENMIEPREIIAGPYVGKWAASPAIATDPAHADLSELIGTGHLTSVSIANAWPPEDA